MALLLGGLLGIIGGYLYITDSNRVRSMAEAYLSEVLGGKVHIGSATLSVFEGLRLDDVVVRVDEQDTPDAVIFSARTFHISHNHRAMLAGRMEATRIVATEPHVRLTENLDAGRWNFQRMAPPAPPPIPPDDPHGARVLPEILLRDAQLDYSEIRAGVFIPIGSLDIEGSLAPGIEPGRYSFKLQSRGESDGLGPELSGSIDLPTGALDARLRNFRFDDDIRRMLMAQVRDFWDQHRPEGRVDVPVLHWRPAKDSVPESFRVEMELRGVSMEIPAHRLAGTTQPAATGRTAPPVEVDDVAGRIIFTEAGIEIPELGGVVESNALRVSGSIAGYSPDAAATLRIRSRTVLDLPAAPGYLVSLPLEVRAIYQKFQPSGRMALDVTLDRPAGGARPRLVGEIRVLDGGFTFDKFPYPVRKVRGLIQFTRDRTGMEILSLDLHGAGAADGLNRDLEMTLSGWMGPLTEMMGAQMRITAKNVRSEPTLIAAFPVPVRKTLRGFDAEGKGNLPRFAGSFVCDIACPIGPSSDWVIATHVSIDSADVSMAAFAYPLQNLSATLDIRDDYMVIEQARMSCGAMRLGVKGRVDYGAGGTIRPDLTIDATGVPIDADLLGALAGEERQWVERAGLRGQIDIAGRIFPFTTQAAAAGRDVDFDLGVQLREGVLKPNATTRPTLSAVSAKMRLTPGKIVVEELTARRESAHVAARGQFAWAPAQPRQLDLVLATTNLKLDPNLYAMLPAAAKTGWDQVRPEGTIDANLTYSAKGIDPGAARADVLSGVDSADHRPAPATSAPGTNPTAGLGEGEYRLVIIPRELAATPKALPYRLEKLTGSATITPQQVTISEATALHGEATLKFSGGAALTESAPWKLAIAAEGMEVDTALLRALPVPVASLLKTLKYHGKISFDIPSLVYHPAEAGDDADFTAILTAAGADLDAGVDLRKVIGTVSLTGAMRRGKLSDLGGKIAIESALLADRPIRNFSAELYKPTAHDALRIGSMRGNLGGGEMAGEVNLVYPESGATRFAMALVVRDADIKALAGETDRNIRGRLTASLAMEGNLDDPGSRRGRGDVSVEGKELYRIPLILGLLQVTNLGLPLSGPFNQGTVVYSVEGRKVTFEQIELRSRTMSMVGTGTLDYASKRVKLSFVTDNPNLPKLPILQDLLNGAKQGLLRVNVTGSIEELSGTRRVHTYRTTVDAVEPDKAGP